MYTFRRILIVLIAVLLVGTLSAIAQSEQTATSENGLFTLQYPEDWFAESEGSTIYLANVEDNLRETFASDLEGEEGMIQVTVDTPDRLISIFGLEIDYDPTPLGLLTPLSEKLQQSGLELETGVFTQDGGTSRAYVRVSGENNQGQIHVIHIGSAYAVIQAAAAPRKLAFLQETVEAVIQSITWNDEAALDRESTSWELTEPYEFDNGLATLLYPKSWFTNVLGEDVLIISNGERTVGSGTPFSKNDAAVVVLVDTLSNLRRSERLTTAITDTPLQLLEAAIERERFGIYPASELDDPVELLIAGHAAASATATIPGFQQTQIIVIEIADEVIAVVRVTTKDGELDRWRPAGLAIAESITFNGTVETAQPIAIPDIPLLETGAIDDAQITFNFPEGWSARAVGNDALMVANNTETLSRQLDDEFKSGGVQIFVRSGTAKLLRVQTVVRLSM